MKSLVLSVALLASAQSFAFGLESHYGKLSMVGGKHACTLTNKTGADLDIKRVEFQLERLAGKNREVVFTKSVNSVIYAGETMTVVSDAGWNFTGYVCKFLAR
ncbi:hypothetical protein [Peredibacter starrii]|uniref:Uncharacterized protein n=1 Tax=Peredibacter starrii TaxID=28202 RepID=A0AAX4HUZ3_9BACT|nr:hypothetical protein [Peredibacter starrii]WPU66796.1 hypothetical protein SOO65_08550 [Peredibacter starrii]